MVHTADDGWNDLVRDLAARVALFAPDWTDSTEHDPGITLLELFAFLGESLLRRPDSDPPLRTHLATELARLERMAGAGCDDTTLVRPRFVAGQLLTAADLEQEQDYHRAKHRRHNRLLHGTGVVHGFEVSIEGADKGGKPSISVSPGVAIDPYGEELVLCERTTRRPPPRAKACFVSVRLAEGASGTGPDGEATRIEESAEVVVQADVAPRSLGIARLVRRGDTWLLDSSFNRR